LFILVSDRLDRIMPTIRSRCRLLALGRPTAEVSLAWLTSEVTAAGVKANQAEIEKVLSEAGGAVMDARDRLLGLSGAGESAQEIAEPLLKALGDGSQINWLQTAEAIHKAPMAELLVTLERWTADLMRFSPTATEHSLPRAPNPRPLANKAQPEVATGTIRPKCYRSHNLDRPLESLLQAAKPFQADLARCCCIRLG
jgi:DNA polymerase-3 subunit delta'